MTWTIASAESETKENRSGTPAAVQAWNASRAMRRRSAERRGAPPDSPIQTVIGRPSSGQRRIAEIPSSSYERYVSESLHPPATLRAGAQGALLRQPRTFNELRADRCSLCSTAGGG